MVARPAPPYELEDPSLEWRVEVDEDWTTAPLARAGLHGCRHSTTRKCLRPMVAVMIRRRNRYAEPMDLSGRWSAARYGYCRKHMYGRWIEDGVVVSWRVRPVGA